MNSSHNPHKQLLQDEEELDIVDLGDDTAIEMEPLSAVTLSDMQGALLAQISDTIDLLNHYQNRYVKYISPANVEILNLVLSTLGILLTIGGILMLIISSAMIDGIPLKKIFGGIGAAALIPGLLLCGAFFGIRAYTEPNQLTNLPLGSIQLINEFRRYLEKFVEDNPEYLNKQISDIITLCLNNDTLINHLQTRLNALGHKISGTHNWRLFAKHPVVTPTPPELTQDKKINELSDSDSDNEGIIDDGIEYLTDDFDSQNRKSGPN